MNNSVECMIVLLNRVNTRETATLVSAGADGWVRAWSTTFRGGEISLPLASCWVYSTSVINFNLTPSKFLPLICLIM